MRKALLLAGIATLVLAGVTYAATTVTPKYILNGKVTPIRSGTAAHPVSISSQLGWTVTTSPPGQRPPVVQGYRFYITGVRANTNDFPACSSSTLNSTGPTTCRKGSLIGSGNLQVAFGPSATTTTAATCQADFDVFDGGGHTLLFYVFKGTEANACPLPPPGTFVVVVRLSKAHRGRDLVVDYSAPAALRHPGPGLDAAIVKATLSIRGKQTTVKKRVGSKTVKQRVGLLETTYCPSNHQRTVTGTFTPENAATQGRTATKHFACT